jgi:Tol biopolymer transport system component
MKKIFFLLVFTGQLLYAQQIDVTAISVVKSTQSGGFYHPKFSPAGDFLLATSENFIGLKQIVFANNTLQTLTSDAVAGYGVQIRNDGNTIVYKKTDFINNLRNTSLISLSRATGNKIQLVAPTREPLTPKFAENKPLYVKGKTLVRPTVTNAETKPVICIEDQKMVLYTAASRKVLTPNGAEASYIWPVISPDQKHIAYTVAGKGTFVCRIDGSQPQLLGKVNAPVWLNNMWIVGMDDIDDGEKLISSTLVAATIDGKVRQTLNTPRNRVAMYPAASADGKRIAFNTNEGELYIMSVQIK